MATYATDRFIEQLRRVVLFGGGQSLTDASLLRRFAEDRDHTAFEAIVRRHGPMVWGVCRRILSNSHDAEDAFQATFLVLVRKAASLRPRDMVGSWLYGVAHQTAIRTRALNIKRSGREKQVTIMPHPRAARANNHHDLHDWLDQELSRLLDKYRAAIGVTVGVEESAPHSRFGGQPTPCDRCDHHPGSSEGCGKMIARSNADQRAGFRGLMPAVASANESPYPFKAIRAPLARIRLPHDIEADTIE